LKRDTFARLLFIFFIFYFYNRKLETRSGELKNVGPAGNCEAVRIWRVFQPASESEPQLHI